MDFDSLAARRNVGVLFRRFHYGLFVISQAHHITAASLNDLTDGGGGDVTKAPFSNRSGGGNL